jgi:peroxiredoxin-like protein
MSDLPHQYHVKASASATSTITSQVDKLADLEIAPPENFGGPGNLHSPEDLQTAAVASCFILSFKAIARASRLEWDSLQAVTRGTLDMVERSMQFTEFTTTAKLTLPDGSSRDKAAKLLDKAEKSCLITNSLSAESRLEIEIEGGD